MRTNLHQLGANILAGTKLALMRPVRRQAFHVSLDQAVLLLITAITLKLAYDFVEAGSRQTFNVYGFATTAAQYLVLLFSAYLIARLQRCSDGITDFVVLLLAAHPAMFLSDSLLAVVMSGKESTALAWAFRAGYFGWMLVVVLRALHRAFGVAGARAFVLTGLYALVNWPLAAALPSQPFWYSAASAGAGGEEDRVEKINIQETYYSQWDLLESQTATLAPQRPGITDLYFVGFGSYSYQDVFLKEVRAVQKLFDERFDTHRRSLALINNRATVREVPLANAPNLRHALARIAQQMDPTEDMLFLFLTSHGSDKFVLSADFWPLQPNNLSAQELRTILDESGIQWSVIVVSACYSGGFIDVLKNDRSLILTAASKDRRSFGCGYENAFTYFGQAYFNEALRAEYSFVEAFYKAAEQISQRERKEKKQASLPQMHVGIAIQPRLDVLERRLRSQAGLAVYP